MSLLSDLSDAFENVDILPIFVIFQFTFFIFLHFLHISFFIEHNEKLLIIIPKNLKSRRRKVVYRSKKNPLGKIHKKYWNIHFRNFDI